MRLMPGHKGYTGRQLPPLHLLEPLIEKTDHHWLWKGEFHAEMDLRFAVFLWAPPSEHATWYVVARVLWSHVRGQSLFHKRFRNTCDAPACVNPDHFEPVLTADERKRQAVTLPPGLKLGDGTGARLVRLPRAIQNADRVHILRDESSYTACYRAAGDRHIQTMPQGTPITCEKCLKEWRDFERPLLAVEDG